MSNISISNLTVPKLSNEDIEIVERKGKGHPDTICDALAEELSIALSNAYREKFGFILHHNVDKALLVGGGAEPRFRGGEVKIPIEIYLTGRASHGLEDKKINVDEIALKTAQEWLKNNLRNINPSEHVDVFVKVKPGSRDLVELFERFQLKGEVPLANDTSFGAGFAPFSDTENIALNLEKYFNSNEIKEKHPFIGEDIKVMGVRIKDKIRITIAMAFVDKFVNSIDDYFEKKEVVEKMAYEEAAKYTKKELEIFINTADNREKESVYITVTGTSSESGDDGQVGRGNRVNGLITPYRPMSLEAAAGKNPISHVGKIYNTAAMYISERIVKEIEEIDEVYTYIVSQIGKPITEPQALDIKIRSEKEIGILIPKVQQIAEDEISKLPETWKKILNREFRLY